MKPGKRSEARCDESGSEYHISKPHYHYDLRLRKGHSGLVNEYYCGLIEPSYV